MCFKTASEYCVLQYSVKKLIVLLLYYSVRILCVTIQCQKAVLKYSIIICITIECQNTGYWKTLSENCVTIKCQNTVWYNTLSEYSVLQYSVRILSVTIHFLNSVTIYLQNNECHNKYCVCHHAIYSNKYFINISMIIYSQHVWYHVLLICWIHWLVNIHKSNFIKHARSHFIQCAQCPCLCLVL